MKVSRSCYYEWLHKTDAGLRVKEDSELTALVKQEFIQGRKVYV
jgi:hypothetical protein